MRIPLALAIVLIPFSASAQTASLTGAVLDITGAYVPNASAELDSGTKKYQVKGDDTGVYRFVNLPAGEYTLRLAVPGFKTLTIKAIVLAEDEQKRTPDVTLEIGSGCGDPSYRDFVRPLLSALFGRLTGSVRPPMADVQVTLVCRTFRACGLTKTDSHGAFSFDVLTAGVYGLRFRQQGFYPVEARGYSYTVDAGWDSVYTPIELEQCPNGNCDPELRPQRPVQICE